MENTKGFYYLEDVIIEGFKSFSEATNMSFKPGIGVIIGNNGVGKSNILDAILWAFGEDDLLKLRCYNISELFFWGSRDHKPASKISVQLTFKEWNNPSSKPIQIKRSCDIDGTNSFSVDEKDIDRQNFCRFISKIGLGDVTKTIIRQDQINDIFYLNPHDRLEFIRQKYFNNNYNITEILEKSIPIFKNYVSTLVPKYNAEMHINNSIEIEISSSLTGTKKAHQLSGGEKAVVALAFKAALFKHLNSSIYFFDEVEPSLDYVNHKSLQLFLREISRQKQLIIITHLRATVELADTLHGVRTRMDGSTFMKFYFVMDKRLLRLYKCC